MTATLTETRSPHAGAAHGPGVTASTPIFGRAERGGRGGGGGGRGGPMTIDPRDRAQLADAPVPMSRVVALFRPHRVRISVVCALIVQPQGPARTATAPTRNVERDDPPLVRAAATAGAE